MKQINDYKVNNFFTYFKNGTTLKFQPYTTFDSSAHSYLPITQLVRDGFIEKNNIYYYITSGGSVRKDTDEEGKFTSFRKGENNYFLTEAEAIKVRDEKREAHQLKKDISDAADKLAKLIQKKFNQK